MSDAPATLDFGAVFGEWGLYTDGDGEPSFPDVSFFAYGIPDSFSDTWTSEEGGAIASATVSGNSAVTTTDGLMVIDLGISATIMASVAPWAPPGSEAVAAVSIDEFYFQFDILTDSILTVESLQSDGGWSVVSQTSPDLGFNELTLNGASLTLNAERGQTLEEGIEFAWRISIMTVPGPGAGMLMVLGGLAPFGRRRRRS